MLVHSSIRWCVRLEPVFLEICSLVFPEILHSDRNLEKKETEVGLMSFPEKFIFGQK